jgi:hypothetical protein
VQYKSAILAAETLSVLPIDVVLMIVDLLGIEGARDST